MTLEGNVMKKTMAIITFFHFLPLLTMENKQTRPRAASVDSPKNRKADVYAFAKQKSEALLRLSQSENLNNEITECRLPDVKDLTPREYMRIRTLLKEKHII